MSLPLSLVFVHGYDLYLFPFCIDVAPLMFWVRSHPPFLPPIPLISFLQLSKDLAQATFFAFSSKFFPACPNPVFHPFVHDCSAIWDGDSPARARVLLVACGPKGHGTAAETTAKYLAVSRPRPAFFYKATR